LDPDLVGRDESSGLAHAVERGQHGLDPFGGDFFATNIQDVILATRDDKQIVGRKRTQVARVEPALRKTRADSIGSSM
jgi:hypothetical protein